MIPCRSCNGVIDNDAVCVGVGARKGEGWTIGPAEDRRACSFIRDGTCGGRLSSAATAPLDAGSRPDVAIAIPPEKAPAAAAKAI